ncbi:GDSL-type esterase/lipase family protein [Streptomyces sp. NBC_01239]|uniref:SGNH/GDSL hydrolase family protein n=1 Tax=Streptomyces sp. NBC_01239 TaxID=2903792 RepID=UPI00225B4CE8|nr:SGNH/GDSL hydrolase family protein [Streptomyces sp. NBC_01239]MCX4815213.1 GDSL-type esterase/lipase family protein [Streptomyces sp. NBC_01239]
MIRVQPERFLRGVLPGLSWADDGARLPLAACGKLTADTVRAARVAAALHLAFTGSASVIELTVGVGERTTVPAPDLPAAFVVRTVGQPPREVRLPADGGIVSVPLPRRAPETVVRVYLPEAVEVAVLGLAADRPLHPAPRGPLWVVYGDSITQGWSVSTPGLAWPSQVADALGLDLVNLGFAGAARGELPAADVLAASGAGAVAMAWGTNAYSSLPTSTAQIAETTRLFLTTVRAGLPDAPVTVVSPIVRPDAEDVPNRFGATLADLREAQETAVRRFAAVHGDDRVSLVPGLGLVRGDQLVDGIHPGDEGHTSFASGVIPRVAAGLGQAAERATAGTA